MVSELVPEVLKMKQHFKKNGVIREVKTGFSWTVFFFGAVALFVRGQTNPGLVILSTVGFAWFYYIFKANKVLAEQLKIEGWSNLNE